MDLLVIRHAIAVEREDFEKSGKSDDLRPLTPEGERKMRRVAKGLRAIAGRPDLLVTSPLTRAEQTAEILAAAYDMKIADRVAALRPESKFTMFAAWAGGQDHDSTIAIVGHEPHLSGLVSWLMSGDTEGRITLKKGGACLLTFSGAARRASGTLAWLMTPRQLRGLGD